MQGTSCEREIESAAPQRERLGVHLTNLHLDPMPGRIRGHQTSCIGGQVYGGCVGFNPGKKDCRRSGAAPYVDDPAVFESAEIETLKERVDFQEIIDVFKMHSIGSVPIGVGHRECFPPEAVALLGSAGRSLHSLSNLFG